MSRESASHSLEFVRKAEKYIAVRKEKADALDAGRTCSVRLDEELNKRFTSLMLTTGLKQTDLIKKLLTASIDQLDISFLVLETSEKLDPPLRDIREAQIKWIDEYIDPEPEPEPEDKGGSFIDNFEKYEVGFDAAIEGLKQNSVILKAQEAVESARELDKVTDQRIKDQADVWDVQLEGESDEAFAKRRQLIHTAGQNFALIRQQAERMFLGAGVTPEQLPRIMKELLDIGPDDARAPTPDELPELPDSTLKAIEAQKKKADD